MRNWDKNWGKASQIPRMKESGERIHERRQAIAVGNNNPCREMRRALSVDENQTHLIFASQLHGNPRPFHPVRGCLNFSPIQEDETRR